MATPFTSGTMSPGWSPAVSQSEAGESLEHRLLRRLLRAGEELGIDLASRAAPAPLAAAAGEVQRAAEALLRFNDPRHLYLHCLCDTP